MDPRFDKNEAEFAVLVFAVAFQMLSNCHGLWCGIPSPVSQFKGRGEKWGRGGDLFDEHVEIFWNLWCEALISLSALDQAEALSAFRLILPLSVFSSYSSSILSPSNSHARNV